MGASKHIAPGGRGTHNRAHRIGGIMRNLSISRAWEESKAIIAREGRLFTSVALALVALPALVTGVIRPDGVSDASTPIWVDLVMIIASLIALAGQLALIRLAIGPSISVGEAIRHGLTRMPVYLLAAILIIVALLLLAVPFAAALIALGVPMDRTPTAFTPGVALVIVIYFAAAIFLGVKMCMSATAASAEPIGAIAIIKRSWDLTDGHWWRLFGFLLLFFIAAVVLLIGAAAAVGAVDAILLGPIDPMSASALVLALVQAVLNTLITTVLAVMLARIYVQLSGRGEVTVPISGT
jgi:hypothetical protein